MDELKHTRGIPPFTTTTTTTTTADTGAAATPHPTTTMAGENPNKHFADIVKQNKILLFSKEDVETTKSLVNEKNGNIKLNIPDAVRRDTQRWTILDKIYNNKTCKPEHALQNLIEKCTKPIWKGKTFVTYHHKLAFIQVRFNSVKEERQLSTLTLKYEELTLIPIYLSQKVVKIVKNLLLEVSIQ